MHPKALEGEAVPYSQFLVCGDYICIIDPNVNQEIKVLPVNDLFTKKRSIFDNLFDFRRNKTDEADFKIKRN